MIKKALWIKKPLWIDKILWSKTVPWTKKALKAKVIAISLCVSGCGTFYPSSDNVIYRDSVPTPVRVGTAEKDRGPDQPMDVAHIDEPVPRHEPILKAGNKSPYVVGGKKYRINFKPKGLVQTGYASWYGKKFHGKRTSNGEIYNMYGMTAAHKTLPIPTYIRVTNLENQRSVIVRVNDRGPFHSSRIVDLTYTAAKKLGFHTKGTAKVRVKVLDPDDFMASNKPTGIKNPGIKNHGAGGIVAPAPRNSAGYDLPAHTYLQAGAFSSKTSAQLQINRLRAMTHLPIKAVHIPQRRLFKVLIGPISDNFELVSLREKILLAGIAEPHVVYEP